MHYYLRIITKKHIRFFDTSGDRRSSSCIGCAVQIRISIMSYFYVYFSAMFKDRYFKETFFHVLQMSLLRSYAFNIATI